MTRSLFEVRSVDSSKKRVPLILSIPHAGVNFPEELQDVFLPEVLSHPADTDWFVDNLYDFAADIGVTSVVAKISRYVIDLNRDPQSKSLYDDGRRETALCPVKTFMGQNIIHAEKTFGAREIARRFETYYKPYHECLRSELQKLRAHFPQVLLFDAHSICSTVPSIRPTRFPDLILGNDNGRTCSSELIKAATHVLTSSAYTVAINDPFRGGAITRSFGDPLNGIHALQLEMCQDIYMDEKAVKEDHEKAKPVRKLLRRLLEELSEVLRV